MSDRLTEVIFQAAFDRHVLIDRTDCEAIAAAARAFIGDKLHTLVVSNQRLDELDEAYRAGLVDAEQIARGDTK